MRTILPVEIINYIFEYENPYKYYFTKNIIKVFKSKYNYKNLLKQLKQYCVYNINKELIYFSIDSILG